MNSICIVLYCIDIMIQFPIVRTREKKINRGSVTCHKGGGGRAEAEGRMRPHGHMSQGRMRPHGHMSKGRRHPHGHMSKGHGQMSKGRKHPHSIHIRGQKSQ